MTWINDVANTEEIQVFHFLQTVSVFSFDDPSACIFYVHVSMCSCVFTHVYMCNPSHWFWLSMIGSVMRCHKIRLIWGWAKELVPDAPCQFLSLPLSSSLSLFLSLCHTHTHTHTHRLSMLRVEWEDMWSFVSVHLQCICISAPALVKVNTASSLWLDQYVLSFSICTHSHSCPVCVNEIIAHQQNRVDLFAWFYKIFSFFLNNLKQYAIIPCYCAYHLFCIL